MDSDIEQIHELIVDMNYPVTLADLKNPTSECMSKVMLTFLSRLSIDGKTIQRATFEQDQYLSYPEVYYDIISLINLHTVMSKICDHIFIKDFFFTDMTNPGAKKVRRLIRTLLNFDLYYTNKMEELTEPLEVIFGRVNTVNDLREKKKEVMELRTQVVLENSKKVALKEKLLKELEETKKRLGEKNKKITADEKKVQSAKHAFLTIQQDNVDIEQQVSKLTQKTAEMESTIVKSPEEYKAQLANFKQEYALKTENIRIIVDKIRDKRELIALVEKVTQFVNQEFQKFGKVRDARLEIESLLKLKGELANRIDEIKSTMEKLTNDLGNTNDDGGCDSDKIDKLHAQCEEKLVPLREMHAIFTGRIRNEQEKLKEVELRSQRLCCEKEQTNKVVSNVEKETSQFLKECQNLYRNDLQKEIEIENIWKSKHDKN